MADIIARDTKAEVTSYIKDKKIKDLFSTFTQALLKERPDDPEKFLRDYLDHSVTTRDAILKIQSANRGRVARAQVMTRSQLKRAKKKFDAFDVDGNGHIDKDEIKQIADWIFESFNPNGDPLKEGEAQRLKTNLISLLDADGNGRLEFNEFASWFTSTCEDINQYRREAARAERAEAALMLQGLQRQKLAKNKVQTIKQGKAATKLQGLQRQKGAKKRVEGIKQDKAATKLQSKQRQKQAQKRVEELKAA
jgi:Ca2+-binding EF-hand superfamily protein